jgi:putative nucleotidyltransferase with HDIG domain
LKIKNLKNRAIIILISAAIALSLFFVVLKFADIEQNRLYEAERATTAERYVRFQSAVEGLINGNITILNGYMAFLSMEEFSTQESAVKYLENLVDENETYIKNISTLEDTTIKFVYPIDNNESAIGLDLADMDLQKDSVLKVKESLKPTFQGPIDLVQGGTGFVARVPKINDSGDYEGQISLVISGETFLGEIDRLAKMHGLKVLFFKTSDYPDRPFYGDAEVLDSSPLNFFMRNEYVFWTVAAIPYDGWTESYSSVETQLKLGSVFSILTFFFAFFAIDMFDQSRVKLREKNFEITSQRDEIEALYEESFAMNQELEYLIDANRKNFFDTVSSLVHALDAKDTYTGGHSQRVKEYSIKTAEKLGLDEASKEVLSFGSILHDIGKIGIPESILNKEGALTDEEYKMIVRHPHIGHNIIENLDLDSATKRIVHEHHERVDGRGYPNRLKGDEIHLFSKIVCIADAFDAMTSKRSYRAFPMTHSEAISELERNRNTQFDGDILDVFVEILKEEISEE